MSDAVSDVVRAKLAQNDRRDAVIGKVVKVRLTSTDALDLVNELRVVLGWDELEELPPGQPGNPDHCVLANAMSFGKITACVAGGITLNGVGEEQAFALQAAGVAEVWGEGLEQPEVHIDSQIVGQFISLFDAGDMPRLEEGAE